MKAIKWVLTERWYAWEDAWDKAQTDPDIDLAAHDGDSPIYLPKRDQVRTLHTFEFKTDISSSCPEPLSKSSSSEG